MEPARFVPKTEAASPPDSSLITVTERAAQEIKTALVQEGESFAGVRLAVLGQGCCGAQYGLALAKSPEDGDVVVERDGVKVFVSPQDSPRVQGVKLDFVETPQGAGFHIDNPNEEPGAGHGHGGHGHGHGGGGCACGAGGCGC